MFHLLKKMKTKEWVLAAVCFGLILGQIFFDLTMPEYMSQLTILIQTPGSAQGEIWNVGLQMLGCALASLVLTVICGYFTSQIASGFSRTLREDLFEKIADFGKEEMERFSVPSLIVRTTEDVRQIQLLFAMGLQIMVKAPIMAVWAVIKIIGKSWELSVVTAGFVVTMSVCHGTSDHGEGTHYGGVGGDQDHRQELGTVCGDSRLCGDDAADDGDCAGDPAAPVQAGAETHG